MEQKQNNIGELMGLLWSKVWIIIILAVVIGIAGYIYGQSQYVERYTSTATFIVVSEELSTGLQATAAENSISKILASTFPDMLVSDESVNAIIAKLTEKKLKSDDISTGSLKNFVGINTNEDNYIIKISVKTTNAARSQAIAEAIIDTYPTVLSKTLRHTASLEVINKPTQAKKPDSFNKQKQYMGIGLFVGVILSAVIIILQEIFRKTLKSAEEMAAALEINVVASIPFYKKEKNQKMLLINNQRASFSFIETYKSIRTKVENLFSRSGLKALVVSSALENEGKTTVAVNLAIALAKNDKKVLIIDADMRHPTVTKILEMKGISEEESLPALLRGSASAEKCIKFVENINLYVLPSVTPILNSSELLSHNNMKNLLVEMKKVFDYIIIDTAPSSIVTDAEVISSFVDASLLVVRNDFASYQDIKEALDCLSQNNAEFIGAVYNFAEKSKSSYRNYGSYYKYRNT